MVRVQFHAAASSDPAAAPAQGRPSGGSPDGTVLVIEDESGVREMMRHVLERAGLRVLLAGSGAEGIRLARECPDRIDVVLSDFVMPGLNGDEVLRQVHAVRPAAALVLMSGYAAPFGRIEGLTHELLPKPFSPRELVEVVRRQLASGPPDPAP